MFRSKTFQDQEQKHEKSMDGCTGAVGGTQFVRADGQRRQRLQWRRRHSGRLFRTILYLNKLRLRRFHREHRIRIRPINLATQRIFIRHGLLGNCEFIFNARYNLRIGGKQQSGF